MIYADHAATTKMSAEAMAAMVKGWEVYGNPSSLHTIGQEAAVVLQKAREQIAVCLDADPKEIYFTSGGSEADNQALRSAAAIGKRKGHMHIISTAFEHHAILHTLEQLKAEGFSITLLDVHENGMITPEQVEAAIQPDTCLVTVMYANNRFCQLQKLERFAESTMFCSIPMPCRQWDTFRFPLRMTTLICYPSPPTNSMDQRELAFCMQRKAFA